MIIGPDSPFVQLPKNLDPRQALFLDGIRFAAQMVDLAHGRLCDTLFGLATSDRSDGADIGPGSVAALLDAWAIVDAINRLRDLQHQMPGLKKRAGYKVFMQYTEPFAELRNILQHLNNEIPQMASDGYPVWGVLRWFVLLDPESFTGRSCVLVAGRFTEGQYQVVNPASKEIRSRVDHVTLTCKQTEASLSDGMRTVESMVKAVEPSLEKSFAGSPRSGTDLLFMADMQFHDMDSSEG